MTRGSNLERSVELLVVGSSKLEKNVESLVESVEFVIRNMVTKNEFEATLAEIHEEMATKDDLQRAEQRLGQRIGSLSNRLDYELDKRKQLEVRVTQLER